MPVTDNAAPAPRPPGPGPHAGLGIIELGEFVAAPYCPRLLGDLGADVIKVEPPGAGDPVRQWGAVPRAIRRPGDLGEDALLLGRAVADPMAAAVTRHEGGQPTAVEARHPARDGVAGAAPDKLGRRRVALSFGHGQQRTGTGNLCRWCAPRPSEAG